MLHTDIEYIPYSNNFANGNDVTVDTTNAANFLLKRFSSHVKAYY